MADLRDVSEVLHVTLVGACVGIWEFAFYKVPVAGGSRVYCELSAAP